VWFLMAVVMSLCYVESWHVPLCAPSLLVSPLTSTVAVFSKEGDSSFGEWACPCHGCGYNVCLLVW